MDGLQTRSNEAPAVGTGGLRVCIHRGTKQIGGTCVELERQGSRILLDLGMPLDADDVDDPRTLAPRVAGLDRPDPSLLAVVVTHGHADHWGLAAHASAPLTLVMGTATRRILQAAGAFVPRPLPAGIDDEGGPELSDRKAIEIGPFRITPYLVDHSAYDAYALLVEAGGRRLFYSGDLRGHGRKSALFERLLRDPPRDVDVMLMEGSSLGRLHPEARFPSEAEVETELAAMFRRTPGMALVAASAQNIDRMVSLLRACRRTARTLIIDLYAAEVLRATGNPRIPQSHWPDVAVYVPHRQRVQIKRSGRFDLLDLHAAHRIYPEDLRDLAPRAAMLFRPHMLEDLRRTDALSGARLIWSQWAGYLARPKNQDLLAATRRRGIPLEHAHTSGHAAIPDLQRLAAAVAPRALVPVHTFEPGRFPDLFDNVAVRQDGEWWE